jgi:hypothetical protein
MPSGTTLTHPDVSKLAVTMLIKLNEAAARLRDAEPTGQYWWVSLSILGIFFLGGNYYLFGLYGVVLVGPIQLAFFWILLTQQSHRQALLRREAAVEEANRKFKDAEKNWNTAKDEPLLFSPVEAMTGEPEVGASIAPDVSDPLIGDSRVDNGIRN